MNVSGLLLVAYNLTERSKIQGAANWRRYTFYLTKRGNKGRVEINRDVCFTDTVLWFQIWFFLQLLLFVAVDVVVILGDQIFKKLMVQIHAIKFPVLSKIWSPRVRESKTVLDSGFHAVDSGFQILNSLSLELGFRIPIFRWIPDFLSCRPGSQSPGFQIPQVNVPCIPDSTSKNLLDSSLRDFLGITMPPPFGLAIMYRTPEQGKQFA